MTGGDAAGGCWCFAGSSGRAESLTKLAPHPVLVLEGDGGMESMRRAYQRVIDALVDCDYLARGDPSFEWDFYVASASEWKIRFGQWITDPVRQQMYRARTLFDMRPVEGPVSLWEQVESHALAAVDRDFVGILANDCLASLPPLTFFQDAVVDQEGEQVTTFRLEHSALRPLSTSAGCSGSRPAHAFGARRSSASRLRAARLPEHEAIFREASDTLRIVLWPAGARRHKPGHRRTGSAAGALQPLRPAES